MTKFKLGALLREHKMTQKMLAEKAGIRENTVSRYVKGYVDSIDIAVMESICTALHCSPWDWIEYTPPHEPNQNNS